MAASSLSSGFISDSPVLSRLGLNLGLLSCPYNSIIMCVKPKLGSRTFIWRRKFVVRCPSDELMGEYFGSCGLLQRMRDDFSDRIPVGWRMCSFETSSRAGWDRLLPWNWALCNHQKKATKGDNMNSSHDMVGTIVSLLLSCPPIWRGKDTFATEVENAFLGTSFLKWACNATVGNWFGLNIFSVLVLMNMDPVDPTMAFLAFSCFSPISSRITADTRLVRVPFWVC